MVKPGQSRGCVKLSSSRARKMLLNLIVRHKLPAERIRGQSVSNEEKNLRVSSIWFVTEPLEKSLQNVEPMRVAVPKVRKPDIRRQEPLRMAPVEIIVVFSDKVPLPR